MRDKKGATGRFFTTECTEGHGETTERFLENRNGAPTPLVEVQILPFPIMTPLPPLWTSVVSVVKTASGFSMPDAAVPAAAHRPAGRTVRHLVME